MKTTLSFTRHLLLACILGQCAVLHAAAIFTPNNMPTGWVGEIDVTSFTFTDGTQTIFKGDYVKGEWSGNLSAFPVDADGTVNFIAERWGGGVADADNLDAQALAGDRRIVTMHKNGSKISFLYGSLDATQQTTINSDNTKGTNIVNYVRGDRLNENPKGANYRARKTVMGDIIHSRPLYVGDPDNPRVYVGGNDGMLHAFDANSGYEVFGYVPSMVIPNVKALVADPYVHTYFVDGSPNAAKTDLSGGKTILVGSLGAGGKGIYALDITDPTAASEGAAASKILWEITPTTINNAASASYADLGHSYGIPVIAKMNDGNWAAIVANGYNAVGVDQAVLYIIKLIDGSLIRAISTTSPTAVSDSNPNGLSSPTAIDTNRDGKVDYVYAGDINGNLWKFDLTSSSSTSWSSAKLYTTSPAQAITGRPAVSLHPLGGYMVNFATGRLFTSADATDTTAYYAYGIRDNNTTIVESNIVSQTLTAKTWTGTGGSSFNYDVRVSSSNAVDYGAATPKQGWKMALPAGERVVGDGGLVTNSRYVFTSTNPTKVHAPVDGVAQPQGDNWLNEVEFTTGGGGTNPQFDLDANLTLDDGDRVRSSGTTAQAGPTGIPVSRYIVPGVMSQPIVARLDTLSETYFNTNPDLLTSATTDDDPGISHGHFDFDIYWNVCNASTANHYSCTKNTHVHEYDDKFDVTGVDMQNASLTAMNLVNAIPTPTTQFKVLIANQMVNPAARVQIGTSVSDPWIPVYNYLTPTADSPPPALGTGTVLGTNTPFSSSLPVYQRNGLVNLRVKMPLNAFAQLDWQHGAVACTPATNSFCIVGIMPTATGCVHANQTGLDAVTAATGKPYGGLWMDGALTIQLIKASTPDSAITMENAAYPALGYRLKSDVTSQSNQLAEYTVFWHHPNGKCYGNSAWKNTTNGPTDGAYPDLSAPGSASTRAPGSDDPRDGTFGVDGGGLTGTGTGGTVTGPTSTTTYTFADGSTVTQTSTKNADGSVTVTRTYSFGGTESFVIPPNSGGRQADTRAKTGRVSWREMIRP